MNQTFYISENKSRRDENKFGIFHKNRFNRILDSKEQFSNSSEYIYLFDLEITDEYKLPIKNLDSYISIVARDLNLIKK